jgi:hypothetical protein
MIKETAGNLFEAKAEALINIVNCLGVRGLEKLIIFLNNLQIRVFYSKCFVKAIFS